MRFVALAFLSLLTVSLPAHAEDDISDIATRINRLERDLNFVQKQVYSGASVSKDGSAPPMAASSGQMQVQISKMDQEIRTLRGAIEQIQFSQRQTATELKKLSDDIDFRLRAIEEKQASAAAAPAPAPTPAPAATLAAEPAREKETSSFDPHEKGDAPAKAKDKEKEEAGEFPDSNAHYTHAFKLLNDKKYSEAAASFDAFVKKYPEDPLVSNAYYWLGESYYSRSDFTRAADSFRKGFESSPAGQKAPDNLFKLSKSLTQVKRVNESCVVLAQIIKKYPDAAPRIVKRAEEERATLQCK